MKNFCSNCKGENTYIISETSSNYVYCRNCGNKEETTLKQYLFDSILKSMDTYFKHTQVKSIYDLKVDVRLENGFLIEEINGDILNKKECPFTLSAKDEYFFKNTVDYLIEDDLHISSDEIELHVDFMH
ncbi:hypothetical protein [Intestinibacter bartlettii]|uniref:Uncharacterized protein n=1 Tax=Intestinibacter bartlettii TaxID=261299 RepID=A0ABS6DU25_9FIRM|nr:hypothetical protein [Intestinibacter bartlettii]MBU5334816.1 hypothetical protein [Intestinibacter bartlettii]